VPRTLFHTTSTAEAILVAGFADGDDSYGLGAGTLTGVFLAELPVGAGNAPSADQVLAVDIPDEIDLREYAIVQEADRVWEWCVPAQVLNTHCRTRLLSQEEVDAAVTAYMDRESE
jgi:hypothetical protein